MRKGIYTYYKERLIEIGGNNKCLYLKSIGKKGAYDIGRILEGRGDKVAEFIEFLWTTRRFSLSLINQKEKKQIIENLDIQSRYEKRKLDTSSLVGEELLKASQKNDRIRREESNKAIEAEIAKIKDIKRDVEEIEKETGRFELYIGYPFVFGAISQGPAKTVVKAPLLLFPVTVDIPDENTVEISINEREKIQLNRALIFAYAQSKKLDIDAMDTEFDDLSQFPSIASLIKYLENFHIRFEGSEYESRNIYNYGKFKEPDGKSELSLRYAAVLTRYSLSNSIFNDYSALERKKLSNDAITELLRNGKIKKQKPVRRKKGETASSYTVKMLDYAQSEVVRKVDESGNMVIYGPPGTGKSQTIVNIITDAISKHKKVLVVSQKRAALDVVYNRLGTLNEKAMYITDETKEKKNFYERCYEAHQREMSTPLANVDVLQQSYDDLQKRIDAETAKLDAIHSVLNTRREFGLSLSEMYSSSYMLQKNSVEYGIYTKLIEFPDIMKLGYRPLSEALSDIKVKNLEKLFYDYLQDKEKNPVIDHMRPDVEIKTLCEVKGTLVEIQKQRKGLFNTAKYPYYRQVLAYYYELENPKQVDRIVKLELKFEKNSRFSSKKEAEIRSKFIETRAAIDAHVREYDCLNKVMTPDGYLSVIDNILRGNTSYIKHVYDALDNYIDLRDIHKLFESLDKDKLAILNFAYSISKNYQNYVDILGKLLKIRIYHEVLKYETECKDELSKIVDFQNITARISRYKEEQATVSSKICAGKASKDYDTLYATAENNKDYLYQISKKQKYWPIRKTMEEYKDFIFKLFPCWLLSPDNVSSLLPLEKNLFDLVIFDEASQVFIESTIPAIYRGKNVVVAGDSKQLRPSTTFMKRYLGGDPENQEDYSVQAALEVESLLDLAVARYSSANLTYHYRSRHQELIDFSNHAFYGSNLQIAPNLSKNKLSRPIERYKVNGKWVDRKNTAEAKKIVDILKNIFATRKNNESIGIITFNADQQTCIADMIDKECAKDTDFRSAMLKEKLRLENGEDTSIFIKNLENVQGDERDIIIFSIGYAENELGRVYTNFGSLSAEGGENRLNVAITRAKSKIIVVTSIEPEELKVDTAKHLGPKLLKKYLTYARAVSKGDDEEVRAILKEIDSADHSANRFSRLISVEEEIKERLEKLGYTVTTNLGNANNRISLAIYDENSDRYLVGVELDTDAFASSDSCIERDVCKPKFLEARGWSVIRVWSRDWWLSPQKVIRTITSEAEKSKKL